MRAFAFRPVWAARVEEDDLARPHLGRAVAGMGEEPSGKVELHDEMLEAVLADPPHRPLVADMVEPALEGDDLAQRPRLQPGGELRAEADGVGAAGIEAAIGLESVAGPHRLGGKLHDRTVCR